MNYEDYKNDGDQSESVVLRDEEKPTRTRLKKTRLVKPLKFTCDLCSRSYKYQKNLDRHKCLKPELIGNDGSTKIELPDDEIVVSFM